MSRVPSPPQRVVVLVKRFPRLSETFILNEFLELRRQGLPVELYSIMDPGESRSQPEALALKPEVTYLQRGPLWRELPIAAGAVRRHPWGALRALGWVATRHSRAALRNYVHALILVELLARSRPAHLHAHFLHAPSSIAFIAHKISRQPYSLTGHAKDIYTTLPENLQMRCRNATFVTSCTAANVDHLVAVTGVDPAAVHLCRHGVDPGRFTVAARRPVPGRILSVGRLVPKKGFDVLIRACGELRRRGVPFELRIAGGGELGDELRALAAAEGIAGSIRFLGIVSQPDVAAEMSRADVFALTPVVLPDGDRDGIPNVLLEAMAAGVPVVASAVSGIPEVVLDGVTGRLVPEGRPDAAADALASLLADRGERERLGAAGREQVVDGMRWDQAVQPLRRLLGAALGQRHAPVTCGQASMSASGVKATWCAPWDSNPEPAD